MAQQSIARNSTPTTTTIEPLKAVCNLLANQLNLPAGRMMIDYERWQVPNEGLFCVAGYLGPSETIGAVSYLDTATDEEVDQVAMVHHIQIDFMSIIPDDSARLRKEEVLMALRSFYAKRYLSSVGVGMAWISGEMTDTTYLEAKNYINRYTTRCSVNALHTKRQSASSFDTFSATLQVDSEAPKTIDLTKNPFPKGG